MWKRIRESWSAWFGRRTRIDDTAEIAEGEARTVEVGDVREGGIMAVLCRVDGKLFALDVRCPHAGGMIVDGPLIDGRYALCPLHFYHFDPRTGRQREGFCSPARRYRVVERDGCATLFG